MGPAGSVARGWGSLSGYISDSLLASGVLGGSRAHQIRGADHQVTYCLVCGTVTRN